LARAPWFEYDDAEKQAPAGAAKPAGLDSVAAKGVKVGQMPLPENAPVAPTNVKKLSPNGAVVREGKM